MRFEDELSISLRVNGQAHPLRVEPRVTLVDALRDLIGLTGTKKGCDRGECGACTVHLDGRTVLACMTLAVAAHEAEITTIEGMARTRCCTRCSRPSWTLTPSSAASALRAR